VGSLTLGRKVLNTRNVWRNVWTNMRAGQQLVPRQAAGMHARPNLYVPAQDGRLNPQRPRNPANCSAPPHRLEFQQGHDLVQADWPAHGVLAPEKPGHWNPWRIHSRL
jgi:hypothetical protein